MHWLVHEAVGRYGLHFITKETMKNVILLLATGLCCCAMAQDARQLAAMPVPAQETLRQEMRDNLVALNEVIALLSQDKLAQAGEVAELGLGRTAMGKNAALPMGARPGPNMPRAMHAIAIDGHLAATAFATAASAGNRSLAMQQLAALTTTCVTCHAVYRIR